MRIIFIRKILISLTIVMLNHGCSNNYALFNHDNKISSPAAMQNWRAIGKMAIIDGPHSETTNFKWQQNGEHLTINFINPLGFGTAKLTGYRHKFELILSNGKIIDNSDGELLLAKQLGVKIPLTSLTYWLRGLPNKHLKFKTPHYNQQGQLSSLEQDGWQIDYASYHHYNGIYLPNKIKLLNNRLHIKIVITNWYQ